MTELRCVICTRNQPRDRASICGHCLDRIDDNLARIEELTRWAAGWLAPRTGTGDTGRSVPGSRPPLAVEALDAALGNDVLGILEPWERTVRQDNQLAPYGAHTALHGASVATTVAFLRSWLLRLSEDPTFPIEVFAGEVTTLRFGGKFGDEKFSGLEHLDPDHDKAGTRYPCTAPHPDDDGRECGYRIVIDPQLLGGDLTCRRCGNTTTGGRIILAALSDPGVTVWAVPEDIAGFGIDPATLRQWHRRGHIRRNGNRYDVGAAWRRRMEAS